MDAGKLWQIQNQTAMVTPSRYPIQPLATYEMPLSATKIWQRTKEGFDSLFSASDCPFDSDDAFISKVNIITA
jgi:hypothetical protein